MSEVATFEVDRAEIGKYLGLNPRDPRSHAVVAVCERYALDPVLKHVVVIPNAGVYITRDGLLHVAHRSGALDGIVVEDQGETESEWWAKVSIYRKDMSRPFTFRGRYSKSASNKKYGPEMALKCAEALALRRAFDVAGLPVLEERDAAPAPQVAVVNTARLIPQGGDTNQPTMVDTDTGEIIDAEVIEEDPDAPITGDQRNALYDELKRVGMATKADGLGLLTEMLKRPVESTEDVRAREFDKLMSDLGGLPDFEAVNLAEAAEEE